MFRQKITPILHLRFLCPSIQFDIQILTQTRRIKAKVVRKDKQTDIVLPFMNTSGASRPLGPAFGDVASQRDAPVACRRG